MRLESFGKLDETLGSCAALESVQSVFQAHAIPPADVVEDPDDDFDDEDCFIKVKAFGNGPKGPFTYLTLLPDTGNRSISLMSEAAYRKLCPNEEIEQTNITIVQADKKSYMSTLGRAKKPITLKFYNDKKERVYFQCRPVICRNLQLEFILANKDMKRMKLVVRLHENRAEIGANDKLMYVPLIGTSDAPKLSVSLVRNVKVEPFSEVTVEGHIESTRPQGSLVEFVPNEDFQERYGLLAAASVDKVRQGNRVRFKVANFSDEPVTITKNVTAGEAVLCTEKKGRVYENETIRKFQKVFRKAKNRPQRSVLSVVTKSKKAKGDKDKKPSLDINELRKRLMVDLKLEGNPMLNESEKRRIVDLFLRFSGVLALEYRDIGNCKLFKVRIDTGDAKPVRSRMRPAPVHLKEDLREQVDRWQRQDVTERSHGSWASAMVPVAKPDGSTRWCCDFRELNKLIKVDSRPVGNLPDKLRMLKASKRPIKMFTKIDLSEAFHSLTIHEDDREKTAFITEFGLFHFKRLPFGLSLAPNAFCHVIQNLEDGLHSKDPELATRCLCYFDDIIVASENFDELYRNLESVLEQVQRLGLKIKPSKVEVAKPSVTWLGVEVSPEGQRPCPGRTSALKKWKRPTTQKEARQLAGYLNIFRKWIRGFASRTNHLIDLTKEEHPKWDDKCEAQFRDVISAICKSPLLRHAEFGKECAPFIITVDSSGEGIGSTLSQVQTIRDPEGNLVDREVIISYASRRKTTGEKHYGSYKSELLGVVDAVHHFREFLLNRKFVVRTDNKGLKWLTESSSDKMPGLAQRWKEMLTPYKFDIEWAPATSPMIKISDGLSRKPYDHDDFGCMQPCPIRDEMLPFGDLSPQDASGTSDDVWNAYLKKSFRNVTKKVEIVKNKLTSLRPTTKKNGSNLKKRMVACLQVCRIAKRSDVAPTKPKSTCLKISRIFGRRKVAPVVRSVACLEISRNVSANDSAHKQKTESPRKVRNQSQSKFKESCSALTRKMVQKLSEKSQRRSERLADRSSSLIVNPSVKKFTSFQKRLESTEMKNSVPDVPARQGKGKKRKAASTPDPTNHPDSTQAQADNKSRVFVIPKRKGAPGSSGPGGSEKKAAEPPKAPQPDQTPPKPKRPTIGTGQTTLSRPSSVVVQSYSTPPRGRPSGSPSKKSKKKKKNKAPGNNIVLDTTADALPDEPSLPETLPPDPTPNAPIPPKPCPPSKRQARADKRDHDKILETIRDLEARLNAGTLMSHKLSDDNTFESLLEYGGTLDVPQPEELIPDAVELPEVRKASTDFEKLTVDFKKEQSDDFVCRFGIALVKKENFEMNGIKVDFATNQKERRLRSHIWSVFSLDDSENNRLNSRRNKDCITLWKQKDFLLVDDRGLLCRRSIANKNTTRQLIAVVIPMRLRYETMMRLHNAKDSPSFHRGLGTSMNCLKRYAYWPAMEVQLSRYIRYCGVCQDKDPLPTGDLGKTASNVHPKTKMWSTDVMYMPKNALGMTCVVTFTDMATRYFHSFMSKNQTADALSDCIEKMTLKYGNSLTFECDNAPAYRSTELHSNVAALGSCIYLKARYNPKSLLAERRQGVFKSVVEKLLLTHKLAETKWVVVHDRAVSITNMMIDGSGFSSHERMFGVSPGNSLTTFFGVDKSFGGIYYEDERKAKEIAENRVAIGYEQGRKPISGPPRVTPKDQVDSDVPEEVASQEATISEVEKVSNSRDEPQPQKSDEKVFKKPLPVESAKAKPKQPRPVAAVTPTDKEGNLITYPTRVIDRDHMMLFSIRGQNFGSKIPYLKSSNPENSEVRISYYSWDLIPAESSAVYAVMFGSGLKHRSILSENNLAELAQFEKDEESKRRHDQNHLQRILSFQEPVEYDVGMVVDRFRVKDSVSGRDTNIKLGKRRWQGPFLIVGVYDGRRKYKIRPFNYVTETPFGDETVESHDNLRHSLFKAILENKKALKKRFGSKYSHLFPYDFTLEPGRKETKRLGKDKAVDDLAPIKEEPDQSGSPFGPGIPPLPPNPRYDKNDWNPEVVLERVNIPPAIQGPIQDVVAEPGPGNVDEMIPVDQNDDNAGPAEDTKTNDPVPFTDGYDPNLDDLLDDADSNELINEQDLDDAASLLDDDDVGMDADSSSMADTLSQKSYSGKAPVKRDRDFDFSDADTDLPTKSAKTACLGLKTKNSKRRPYPRMTENDLKAQARVPNATCSEKN